MKGRKGSDSSSRNAKRRKLEREDLDDGERSNVDTLVGSERYANELRFLPNTEQNLARWPTPAVHPVLAIDECSHRRQQEADLSRLLGSARARMFATSRAFLGPGGVAMPPSLPYSPQESRAISWPYNQGPLSNLEAANLLLVGAQSSMLDRHAAARAALNPQLVGLAHVLSRSNAVTHSLMQQAASFQASLPSDLSSFMGAPAASFGGMPSRLTAPGPAISALELNPTRLNAQNLGDEDERPKSDIVLPMALPSDPDNLSGYQCLIRAQIELFEAREQDIECNAQGRNRPIIVGQVGIRCRHCKILPPGRRPRGAVYYPAKLAGLYQAAQNMAINHFTESCQSISEQTRNRLQMLREQKTTVLGGGKQYWANGARVHGICETENGLIFARRPPPLNPCR
jgi:hypothetical protein